MRGLRTTSAEDIILTNCEQLPESKDIEDLLELFKTFDKRLDKAIKRLEEHGINTDDIGR
jgi:DNA polymerase I-like protein with 3'-5' exonuclease and polymerase domains